MQMRYRSLDGLRGLAAYTVIIGHFGNQSTIFGGLTPGSGQLGVMLFFVLSGFLMGQLHLDLPFTLQNVATFYRRRVARVVPLYLLVVLASFVLVQWRHNPWPLFAITPANIWDHLLFWSGSNVLWTVPVEVQFYLCLPILWFLNKLAPGLFVAWAGLIIAVVAAAGFPRVPPLLTYLPFFILGVAASCAPSVKGNRSIDVLFVVLIIAYFALFPGIRAALHYMTPGVWGSPVYMAFVPALLLATRYSPLADRVLGSRPAKLLGDTSYSAYLLHMPILFCVAKFYPQHNWLSFAVFLPLVVAVAYVSFTFIEKPAQRLINGGRRPRRAPEGLAVPAA